MDESTYAQALALHLGYEHQLHIEPSWVESALGDLGLMLKPKTDDGEEKKEVAAAERGSVPVKSFVVSGEPVDDLVDGGNEHGPFFISLENGELVFTPHYCD